MVCLTVLFRLRSVTRHALSVFLPRESVAHLILSIQPKLDIVGLGFFGAMEFVRWLRDGVYLIAGLNLARKSFGIAARLRLPIVRRRKDIQPRVGRFCVGLFG